MHANTTNTTNKLIYPELSYVLNGICFGVQNRIGRYSREKQYCDEIERELRERHIPFQRELTVADTGNRVDFLVDDKIVLEIKASGLIDRKDYYQLQNYLQAMDVKLGLLVNFRSQYLKPKRIIRIEAKNSFA